MGRANSTRGAKRRPKKALIGVQYFQIKAATRTTAVMMRPMGLAAMAAPRARKPAMAALMPPEARPRRAEPNFLTAPPTASAVILILVRRIWRPSLTNPCRAVRAVSMTLVPKRRMAPPTANAFALRFVRVSCFPNLRSERHASFASLARLLK